MAVFMIFKYDKRFRFPPSFNKTANFNQSFLYFVELVFLIN